MDGSAQGELSKDWIIKALLSLMQEKEYQAIKVTEIAKRAGIARLTFYRHFATKEDVLRERSRQLFAAYQADIDNAPASLSLEQIIRLSFEHFGAHAPDNTLLVKNNLTYIFEQEFYTYSLQLAQHIPILASLTPTQRSFFLAGFTRVITDWIQVSEPLPAEILTQEILALINFHD
ncbi:TetR/AcrR family transcriptional regulator [Periweissella cryptocerci]|uniref:TetR/AcrR family transcriptional regulator n=1 Tax=Periweissella cryptocerci TaxID=2506420 RepID=A0A4P6YVN0_9LACO|nr:TetR/AcrR family transcriptional regulator [Periweissella cryptocerci]QBO36858.1 TetR/AcrR family transcriptional regulator [Periweissella cryptocerci]